MRFITVNVEKIDSEKWKRLVDSSSTASFFQTEECYNFYKSLSFLEEFAFAIEEGDVLKGVIVGYIQKDGGKLKQYFSRRAIISGGALLMDDISVKALTLLLSGVKRYLKKRSIYIETRNFNDYSKYKDIFKKCGFDYIPHLNFHVDTSSMDIVNANISRNIKRNYKSALKEGIEILETVTLSDIESFYDILFHAYQNKIKSPLFPLSFFTELYEKTFSKYIIVKFNNEIIGGMCLLFDKRTVYAYFVCGKDNEQRKCFPSTVVNYLSLLFAVEKNLERFDFMGAGKPNEEYGVRDFKAKFGGELVEHGRFLSIVNPVLYRIGKLGVKLIKSR